MDKDIDTYFKEEGLGENGKYCLTDFSPLTEEQDSYFLLCDVLPEDRVLREELQAQRLVRPVRGTHSGWEYTLVTVLLFSRCCWFYFYSGNFQTCTKEEALHPDLRTVKACP